ncbi:MAG: hypothetical protein J7J16_00400 [Deltaproteobacteria bacterium]|nr:hypothetical protein [Deltaproteobacteria bacterium]
MNKNNMEARFKTYFIGIKEGKIISSRETRKQIDEVKKLKCQLRHPITGERLGWDSFDDPDDEKSLFQAILRDRKLRVDQGLLMMKKAPFCVITAVDDIAIRLEFYGGYRKTQLIADIRNRRLQGLRLPCFTDRNPEMGGEN